MTFTRTATIISGFTQSARNQSGSLEMVSRCLDLPDLYTAYYP